MVKEGESVWWTKWWWGERNIHRMHGCFGVCVGVSVELSALHTRHSLHTYIHSYRVHIRTYASSNVSPIPQSTIPQSLLSYLYMTCKQFYFSFFNFSIFHIIPFFLYTSFLLWVPLK